MLKKKEDFLTFMVVPHDGGKDVVNLRIPYKWLYSGIAVLMLVGILVFSSLIYSSALTRRLINYAQTLSKNKAQEAIINKFSDETNRLKLSIQDLLDRDNQLRKLLGLKLEKSEINLKSMDKAENNIKLAEKAIKARKVSFEELKARVVYVQNRFVVTPSIWPIHGAINSWFGYRVYPWKGFHSGIDIQAGYGAPIRAAAAGKVIQAGWYKGYGRAVTIDHGNGLSTLYGHASSLAVNVGNKVAKGQVVAYVGRSGWATGPHLHYEVRKYDNAVNPTAYLNLDVLTASRVLK